MAEDYRKKNLQGFLSDVGRSAWETPVTLGAQLGMMPLAGLSGLVSGALGGDAQGTMDKVQSWAYQPRSQATANSLQAIGGAMEVLDKPFQALGDFAAGEDSQNPLLGTMAYAIPQLLTGALQPTKLLGSGLINAAKVARKATNLDVVDKAAKFVGDTRYNVLNPAAGQLVSRQQLAGEKPGVVQTRLDYEQKVIPNWYFDDPEAYNILLKSIKKGDEDRARPISNLHEELPLEGLENRAKFQHLKEMAKQAIWRNPYQRFTDHQEAWLRDTYGITGNVYRELDRLSKTTARAYEQRVRGDEFYTDTAGNRIGRESATQGETSNLHTPRSIIEKAEEQFHAQVAYNASILEKFHPGDPRLERLLSGDINRFLTPMHRRVSQSKLKEDPKIVNDLLMLDEYKPGYRAELGITDDVIKNHVSARIKPDNRLNDDVVHISSKPFFFKAIENQANKGNVDPPYAPMLLKVTRHLKNNNIEINKKNIIADFKRRNEARKTDPPSKNEDFYFDPARLERDLIDSDGFVSMNQGVRTQDSLLATIQARYIINKLDPEKGLQVLTDQMKQGAGNKYLDFVLDTGSDTNRIYIDYRPLVAETNEPGGIRRVMPRKDQGLYKAGPKKGQPKPMPVLTDSSIGAGVREGVMSGIMKEPPESYKRARTVKRYAPYVNPAVKAGILQTGIDQDY
jgi:hypothetical protein|tara:strand:- start:77 stop:2119 length:2043 start_codon:yes stop_codon:yes gene_type:complete